MKKNPQKSRALKYAALGLRVHPLHSIVDGHCSCDGGSACTHPGKHPRTPNGVKDATIDRKTIKAWWNKWPSANIGIATGRVSDIFVLDVDGDVGKASLKKLKARHGSLPKTVAVKTGRGRHLYFRRDGAEGIVPPAASTFREPTIVLQRLRLPLPQIGYSTLFVKIHPPAPRPRRLSHVPFPRPNLIVLVRTRTWPVIVNSTGSPRRPSTSGTTR